MRRSSLNLVVPLTLTLTMLLLGGCGARAKRWLVFDKGPMAEAIAVDVDSFRGPVTVIADPEIPNVVIRAQLRAFNDVRDSRGNVVYPYGDNPTLDLIDVTAEVEQDDYGHGILRVTSSTRFAYSHDQFVRLMIYVPRVDGVRVHTVDGNVDLVNVRGAVTVVADNGNVILRTDKPVTQPVDINAINGSIEYRIKEDSHGVYDVEAVNGRADFLGYSGLANIHQRGPSQYVATLGDGVNPVSLRATNGNVKIVVTDDPVPIGFLQTHTWMFLKK